MVDGLIVKDDRIILEARDDNLSILNDWGFWVEILVVRSLYGISYLAGWRVRINFVEVDSITVIYDL